jgi:hypothetical protein
MVLETGKLITQPLGIWRSTKAAGHVPNQDHRDVLLRAAIRLTSLQNA